MSKDPAPKTRLGRAVKAQTRAVGTSRHDRQATAAEARRFRRASATIERAIAERDARKLRLP